MVPLGQLTKETVLSDDVLTEIFDQEDEIYKARLLLSIQDRAEELGVKRKFDELVKAYKRVTRQVNQKKKSSNATLLDNWTNFSGDKYENMYCGAWIASDDGVFVQSNSPANNGAVACYHPILPVKRLKNLETGEEHLVLAYKRNNVWREVKVSKDVVASASKIVALSKQGISVTSENAKYLVKYLSDVENLNESSITVRESTAKLGWHGDVFMPYSDEITFDGDDQFRYIYESIRGAGSEELWLKHTKRLRATGKKQIRIALAASFASILVSVLNGLPFIIDFWGQSGSGKSVSAMLAASVWADPSENQYIGGFNTSEVGLEVRCDMLNHLPVILDDTSTISAKMKDFEGVVYSLCSGKGRTRSNKDLGLRTEKRWRNCVITNGERPLRSYVQQGGAINRVLEIECLEGTYEDPAETVACLQSNFGWAGVRFVDFVRAYSVDELKEIRDGFQEQISNTGAVAKQALALAIILTADKIATERIFKDGMYISVAELEEAVVSGAEASDSDRAYQYLVDKINMNSVRFDGITSCEQWGLVEDNIAYIYTAAFNELCRQGGFSKDAFLVWAKRQRLLVTDKDGDKRNTKLKRIDGSVKRCIALRLTIENEPEEGFSPVNFKQEELPF